MRCRTFIVAGLAEPSATRGAGKVALRTAVLRPSIFYDRPYGEYGRYVLEFARPTSLQGARLYTDALAGVFALVLRRTEWFEPIPLPGHVGHSRIDTEFVRRQVRRYVPDELYKSTKVALFEDDRTEDPPMTLALRTFARADDYLPALASYAASWHARIDTGYGIPDRDLIAAWTTYTNADGLASLILHAYRSIEATLEGPLPGRDQRLAARLDSRVPGVSPRTRTGLVRELRHIERAIRGPALHGASRGGPIVLRDALRAQRIAARLLGFALGVQPASTTKLPQRHEVARY